MAKWFLSLFKSIVLYGCFYYKPGWNFNFFMVSFFQVVKVIYYNEEGMRFRPLIIFPHGFYYLLSSVSRGKATFILTNTAERFLKVHKVVNMYNGLRSLHTVFLVAKRLYKSICPSVCPSVSLSTTFRGKRDFLGP